MQSHDNQDHMPEWVKEMLSDDDERQPMSPGVLSRDEIDQLIDDVDGHIKRGSVNHRVLIRLLEDRREQLDLGWYASARTSPPPPKPDLRMWTHSPDNCPCCQVNITLKKDNATLRQVKKDNATLRQVNITLKTDNTGLERRLDKIRAALAGMK